jgi:(p)ppGpp synthase/HD superfamily hydrolase
VKGFDLEAYHQPGPYRTDPELLARLVQIAVVAHFGTKERGNGKPYITHPLRVMNRVAADLRLLPLAVFHPYSHAEVVSAAVVHDVPEDCDPAFVDDIGQASRHVLDLSLQLRNHHLDLAVPATIDPGNFEEVRAWKKEMDFAKIETISHPALLIKYEDRLDNLAELSHWPTHRRARYARESRDLASRLNRLGHHTHHLVRELNTTLQRQLQAAIEKVEEGLV